jgi:hypothetical protein
VKITVDAAKNMAYQWIDGDLATRTAMGIGIAGSFFLGIGARSLLFNEEVSVIKLSEGTLHVIAKNRVENFDLRRSA